MSLGIEPHELARLVHAALNAPEHVPGLRTDTGVTVHIERDPEPGVEQRLHREDDPNWEVILTRAVDTPPERYPHDLPFVPNATAVVARDAQQMLVTWNQEGDLGHVRELMTHTDGLMEDPAVQEIQERVAPLVERAREGDVSARGALKDEAAMARAAMDPDTRDKLRELWERLQPGPKRSAELERIYTTVTEATEAEGWERTSAHGPEPSDPFGARSTTYRRGKMERNVTLAIAFGPISSVMLWERSLGPDE